MISSNLSHRRNRKCGSVLIVAMMFAIALAISLGSYLTLCLNSAKLAQRSFYLNGGQNLADTGLEQALWALNNSTSAAEWTSAGFAERSGHSNQYQGTFSENLSGGVTGQLKVWIDTNYVDPVTSRLAPHIIAQATINLASGNDQIKMAEVYLRPRSPFDSQFAVKGLLEFKGQNPMMDGWDSHSDTPSTADDVIYFDNADHTGSADDTIKVSSLQTISINHAEIYGSASVSPDETSSIDVKSGSVGPYGTADSTLDPDSVSYDFVADFEDVEAPFTVSTSGTINNTLALPSGRAANSTYVNKAGETVYQYQVPSISLSGSQLLTIEPGYNVEITVTGSVSITGNGTAGIFISDLPVPPATALNPSTLTMYVAGDVGIAGQGVTNGSLDPNGNPYGAPINFTLFGTRSAEDAADIGMQTFAIKGNGFLSAAIYAPNANVTINGNGDTYGGVVANNATVTGNGAFHGDTSLSRISLDGTWRVSKWREIVTATERASHADKLNF